MERCGGAIDCASQPRQLGRDWRNQLRRYILLSNYQNVLDVTHLLGREDIDLLDAGRLR